MNSGTTTDRYLARIEAAMARVEREPVAALDEAAAIYHELRGSTDDLLAAAAYGLARARAATGDGAGARLLVEEAANRWERAGDPLRALRTRAGLMQLLTQEGDHGAAVELGRRSLEELAGLDPEGCETGIAGVLHQNVGVAAAHGGAFDLALDSYARAEDAFCAAGEVDRLPALASNRAAELLDLGRLDEAMALLASARASASQMEAAVLVGRCDAMLGWARALAGDIDRGITDLERAVVRFDQLELTADRDLTILRIGEAHLLLSDWRTAERSFRRVLDQEPGSMPTHERCAAAAGVAAALLGAERPEEAVVPLDTAIDGWRELQHLPGLVNALLERAGLWLRRGRRQQALAAASEASELLGEDGQRRWPVHRLYCDLRLVDVLLPDHDAAEPIAVAALERAEYLAIPVLRCRALRRLGTVRLAQGALTGAEALFAQTVEAGERLRSRLPREAQRLSFGDEVDAALVGLTRIHLDRGTVAAVAQAVRFADRRRDRVLSELVDGTVRPDELTLSRDTIGLRATLTAASDALLDVTGGPRCEALRAHVAALAVELAATSRGPAPVLAEDLRVTRASRTTERASLAYTELDGEIVGMVTRSGTVRAVRRLTDLPTLHRLLEDLDAELWSGGLVGGADHDAALVRGAEQVLRELGTALLEPVRHLLPRTDEPFDLSVLPHGLLHDVPFHALISQDGPLVERASVTVCPNEAFGVPVTPEVPRSVLAVGVPTNDTPGIVDELAAFPSCGLDAEILIGHESTRTAVSQLLCDADVLHLACHGRFDVEDPARSWLRLADAHLTGVEIASLDLRHKLVVLSACDSARLGYRGPGAQTLGIARAFLAAGARAVVASRWLVDDDDASATIAAFARHLVATGDVSLALRAAQLERRETVSHPARWAPFAVLGHPTLQEIAS